MHMTGHTSIYIVFSKWNHSEIDFAIYFISLNNKTCTYYMSLDIYLRFHSKKLYCISLYRCLGIHLNPASEKKSEA